MGRGRPKGSKNKPKNETTQVVKEKKLIAEAAPVEDITALLLAKQAERETLTADISTIEENIEKLKEELKEKRAALKAVEKELPVLEAQKAEADAKAAELAQKEQIEGMIKTLQEKGVTFEAIINKLAEATVDTETSAYEDDVPAL